MTVEEHPDGNYKTIFTPSTDTEKKVLQLFILSATGDATLTSIEDGNSLSIGSLQTQQSVDACDLLT